MFDSPAVIQSPQSNLSRGLTITVPTLVRDGLIEGECVENILPNSHCFADVMTKMHHAVVTIPLDSPHSPFSISPNDDVIIIHYFDDNRFAIG